MYSSTLCQKVVFVIESLVPDERASGLRYVNERNEKQGVSPLQLGLRFSV
jgi:hypothetical protein